MYEAYFYFVNSHSNIVVRYENYTARELFKELYERARLWQNILGTIIVVTDHKEMIWEFRLLKGQHIIFTNLKALYGKAYATILWEK